MKQMFAQIARKLLIKKKKLLDFQVIIGILHDTEIFNTID
jgi:predicted CopG family antitoxin